MAMVVKIRHENHKNTEFYQLIPADVLRERLMQMVWLLKNFLFI